MSPIPLRDEKVTERIIRFGHERQEDLSKPFDNNRIVLNETEYRYSVENVVMEDHNFANDTTLKGKSAQNTHPMERLKSESGSLFTQLSLMHANEDFPAESYELKKVRTRNDQLTTEISKLKQQLEGQHHHVRKLASEMRDLKHSLNKMDKDSCTQKKEFDLVLNDRNVLVSQLNCRNDEIAVLFEKVKLMGHLFQKGEQQYEEKLDDIRLLTMQIRELERKISVLKRVSDEYQGMEKKLNQAEINLVRERQKVKLLSDELENPLNVHRWRQLDGKDPTILDMIKKISSLQKKLIKKTEEVMDKDAVIKDQEQKFITLQKQISKSVSPESVHVSCQHKATKVKLRQMKAMAGELNMHQAQSLEFKNEIRHINKKLQHLKSKYFEQRKREMAAEIRGLLWLPEDDYPRFKIGKKCTD